MPLRLKPKTANLAFWAARCVALWLASMALLDLFTGRAGQAEALMGWWLSTYPFAPLLRVAASALFATSLLAFACVPKMPVRRRVITVGVVTLSCCHAAFDALRSLSLHRNGAVPNQRWLPLSALLLAVLLLLLWALLSVRSTAEPAAADRPSADARSAPTPAIGSHAHRSRWQLAGEVLGRGLPWLRLCAGAVGVALLFAVGQMVCFGNSDYRRSADAVVVFGARVYADGRPSLALADRVRTAARLVRKGYAPRLVVSGGPGDGDIHEVEAMAALAIAEGVPANAIVMDRAGLNTRATVRNTRGSLGADRASRRSHSDRLRVLAVSHSYHLPRIKLSYQQQGIEVYTVPAEESRTLLRLPYYMAREGLAFWAHAFRLA